eukprot:gene22322-28908_t
MPALARGRNKNLDPVAESPVRDLLPVVRKVLRSEATEFHYEREAQPLPRIGPWQGDLDVLLAANAARPGRERLTLIRIFEELRGRRYAGGYDAVRRYARGWERERSTASADAYVPLSFAPGEAYHDDQASSYAAVPHARHFGRDQTVYDPWHSVPVLARKPGALRNGAPFKDWVLPPGLERVRRRLAGSADGDRQMVRILTTVLSEGLAVEKAACQASLHDGRIFPPRFDPCLNLPLHRGDFMDGDPTLLEGETHLKAGHFSVENPGQISTKGHVRQRGGKSGLAEVAVDHAATVVICGVVASLSTSMRSAMGSVC